MPVHYNNSNQKLAHSLSMTLLNLNLSKKMLFRDFHFHNFPYAIPLHDLTILLIPCANTSLCLDSKKASCVLYYSRSALFPQKVILGTCRMNQKILSLCNWAAEETIRSHRKCSKPFVWLSAPEKFDLAYSP